MDSNTRIMDLAERIAKLPTTGMIEAECVHSILNEVARVLMEVISQTTEGTAFARQMLTSCEKLYHENIALKTQNNDLAWSFVISNSNTANT